MTPANRPEDEALPAIEADLARQRLRIECCTWDRGHVASPVIEEVIGAGGDVVCRPWVARNGALFAKSTFHIDLRAARPLHRC